MGRGRHRRQSEVGHCRRRTTDSGASSYCFLSRTWRDHLNRFLIVNEGKPSRERLTLTRIYKEVGRLGYEGRYDAARRMRNAYDGPSPKPVANSCSI